MTVVMITGSNSGFGMATALGFLARGDTVAACMRRPERGEDLTRHAESLEGHLEIVRLDVTDADARAAAVDNVIERFGAVDVLVNNAGISRIGALEDTPPHTVEEMFATNVVAPLELMRLVLPHMRRAGGGRIVNVTAIGAILCTPFLTTYIATKHALDAATAAFDLEVRPFGVRAVSVLPGSFRTHIIDDAGDIIDSEPYGEQARSFRAGIHQRIAEAPADLSDVVDAIVEATTAGDPPQRTVVSSEFMVNTLAPAVAAFADLQRIEAERLGLA